MLQSSCAEAEADAGKRELWDTPALCYHAVAVGNLEGLQLLKPQSLGLRTHHWDMLCKRSLQYGGSLTCLVWRFLICCLGRPWHILVLNQDPCTLGCSEKVNLLL